MQNNLAFSRDRDGDDNNVEDCTWQWRRENASLARDVNRRQDRDRDGDDDKDKDCHGGGSGRMRRQQAAGTGTGTGTLKTTTITRGGGGGRMQRGCATLTGGGDRRLILYSTMPRGEIQYVEKNEQDAYSYASTRYKRDAYSYASTIYKRDAYLCVYIYMNENSTIEEERYRRGPIKILLLILTVDMVV